MIPAKCGWSLSNATSRKRLVGGEKGWIVESHPPRQPSEELGVGDGFPERGDGGAVEREVVVAPRPHQVEVFELGRRGQDVVGVASGVGQKLLVDDGEEVIRRRPSNTRRWLGAVDAGLAFQTTSALIGGSSADRSAPGRAGPC